MLSVREHQEVVQAPPCLLGSGRPRVAVHCTEGCGGAKARGAGWLHHYIDDFVAVGAPGSLECWATLAVLKETYQCLRMPLDPGKEEGPAQVANFEGGAGHGVV